MKKIYCKTCKYICDVLRICSSPHNTIETEKENWYEKTTKIEHILKARDINKDNDCEWYEEK